MAIGILNKVLVGGCLILPTLEMSKYLTDRVGRLEEIEPYFPLWRALHVTDGVLIVVAVKHDALSPDVVRIPKGQTEELQSRSELDKWLTLIQNASHHVGRTGPIG